MEIKGPNPYFAMSCSCSQGDHDTGPLQRFWSGTGRLTGNNTEKHLIKIKKHINLSYCLADVD